MITRWRPWNEGPPKNIPYVCDWRSFDIPMTVYRAIMSLPVNCVAITLRPLGGKRMIKAAERAARHRGVRILWVTNQYRSDSK